MNHRLCHLLPLALLLVQGGLTAPHLHAAPDVAETTPTALPLVFVPGISGSQLVDSMGVEYWPAAGTFSHDDLTLYPSQSPISLTASYAITQATVLGVHIPYFDDQTYGPLFAAFEANGFRQYQTGGDPAKRTAAGCDLSQASNNPNLFIFPYDWRLSNVENAALLAEYIACVRRFYPGTQVNLMAHSMGGLVARRYIIANPGANYVNALITAATPWLGAGKLVWVMATGEFVFFVWDSTLLKVIGSFTGAHELMNSQAWYDLGGAPAIVEDWQDLNQNGIFQEQYLYDELVAYMDKFKGKEGFLPGTANVKFHTFSRPQGAQDDWRTDATGVKYFHIVGAGGGPDTINQVIATTTAKCLYYGGTDCDLSTGEYPKYAVGDQTVPLLSSSRNGGVNGNYNAPGATVYTCQAAGKNSANVSHTSMLSNPVVQQLLLQYLAQANGATPAPPPSPQTCGNGGSLSSGPITFHQLTIDGAADLRVSDATTPTNTLPFLRGVSQHRINPTATQLLMAGGEYTVTFKTQPSPAFIEWLHGNDAVTTHAVRFHDVQLPPNRTAQIVVRDGAFDGLRYDSDGDGLVDTSVPPTFAPPSPAPQDVAAPDVTVSSATFGKAMRVAINAQDGGAGVERLLYSFDGKAFTPYVGPFIVDPHQVRVIYAFADDKVGNRSSVRTYRLPKLQSFFPFVSQ
jgi:pimeloyl-ACP methyl ester carboxylesterase